MSSKEPKTEKKEAWTGETVEVLTGEYEEGKPDKIENWVAKMGTREQKLRYLQTAERYWYDDASYGSEKRKNPA